VHDQFRVREDRRARGIDQAHGVVGMDVGEQHDVDGFGRDTSLAQAVGQLPKLRTDGGPAAGIDQHLFAAELEQIAVHRKKERRARRLAQEPLRLVAVECDQGVEGGRERPVTQRRDLDVADLVPHADALPTINAIE
jgi:hypothetical protein